MIRGRLFVVAAPLALAVACGSRTGLLLPLEEQGAQDAGEDAIEPLDADLDVTLPFDAPEDLPGIDVVSPKDVNVPNDCPDAGSTFVYVISSQNVLLAFYPPTAELHTIGEIDCRAAAGATPFSMAVDRQGVAYVVFDDGELFRVSTLTAACTPTTYRGGPPAFGTFGMSFAQDVSDPNETLYLSGDPGGIGPMAEPTVLGSLSTTSFTITTIGTVTPNIVTAELTGTGAGQLFAFFPTSGGTSSAIAELDRTTARIVGVSPLPGLTQGAGWAFGFWGGDFYLFTTPSTSDPNSRVTRYRPSDGSITQVASTPGLTIVGAGVSTCAPQQ